MQPIHSEQFTISSQHTDCFHRLKPSQLLTFIQQVSADHSEYLGTGREALAKKDLFWAVVRHRVQINRLPEDAEQITLETWPMPTTRSAYPRSVVARDAQGSELFRSISLWVLMRLSDRSLVLPGKSGVTVDGCLTGSELAVPGSMAMVAAPQCQKRSVRFTDLDGNGHMNNCRYLDWVADVLPARFHKDHTPVDFSIHYLSEAREGETLSLCWQLSDEGVLSLDGCREEPVSTRHSRVFSVRMQF